MNGPAKLEYVLCELKPDIILVEGSEAKTKVRQLSTQFLFQELHTQKINAAVAEEMRRKQQRLGYETRVSKQYALSCGVVFDYLKDDLPIPSRLKAHMEIREEVRALVRNGVTIERLLATLSERQAKIDDDFNYVQRIVGHAQERIQADVTVISSQDGLGPRDGQMEKTVRNYFSLTESRCIATVTGFGHLLEDSKRKLLYGRVKDLNPVRRFLY